MLQINKSPAVQVAEGGSALDVRPLADLLASIVGFIRRRYLIILSVLPVTIALAVVYLVTTPPFYTALAQIMIDKRKVQVFQQQSILGDLPVDAAMIESEIDTLKSEEVALSVIKNLHLTQDPEFVGAGPGLIGRAKSQLLHLLYHAATDKPKSEFEITRSVLSVFESRLKVARLGFAYVIEIRFESLDPERAAQITNAVADAYITGQLESKYEITRRTSVWLQGRLQELQGQAMAAARAVVDYKTKHNIVDSGGHLINEQQVAELNTALIQARAAKAEAQARFDRITQILRDDNPDPTAAATATVAETLQNQVVIKLRQQYLELAEREADWSRRIGNQHLAVVNLRNRMQEIRRSIVDELRRIAETYKSDYEIAKAREDSIQKSMATTISESQSTNEAQVELRQLESSAQTDRTLYDTFLQRYMDSVQQQSFPISEVRVITRATPPLGKSFPKSSIVWAVATMSGLMLGLGLAMLREISDGKFRTSNQVEAALRTQCVGLVPMIKPSAKVASAGNKAASARTKVASARTKAAADLVTSRIIPPSAGALRYVVDAPLSLFAESIRSVKVGIDLSEATKSNKVIGITSSLPNEGKSTIAASLAQLSAHGGASVILVDCDWRKPSSLSKELVPNATLGLIDVIHNTASLEQVIWSDPTSHLSFLPSGVKSGLIHTNEILASDAMRRVIDKLREKYRYVIIDLPPLAPVVDARSTAHFVDTYLFVIEWGKTKIDVVAHALNSARGIHDNLSGVILNKVDLKLLSRYDGYRSYNYYSGYTEYGHTG